MAINTLHPSSVIFAIADPEVSNGFIELDQCIENGVKTYRAYYRKTITGINVLDKLIKFFLYFIAISKAYNTCIKDLGKPDLLHVHVLIRTGIFAYLKRIPFVITEHWTIYSDRDRSISFIKNILFKFLFRKAKAITTVSKDLKIAIEEYRNYKGHYYIVPNTVSPNIFNIENKPKSRSIPTFIHVSEFNEEQKNISGILNTCHSLLKNGHIFKLKIIGYGKDEHSLHTLCQNLNLNHTVQFLGIRTGKELANELKDADAFILFSRYENQPCVILESMACGTPVISTNVGGINEMFHEKEGILLTKNTELELEEAMIAVITAKKHFDPILVNQRVKDIYYDEAVANNFSTIYQTILR